MAKSQKLKMLRAWQRSRASRRPPGAAANPGPSLPPVLQALLARWKVLRERVVKEVKKRTREYCESSSINCYQYLVDDTLRYWEKYMWWLVHLLALVFAGFVLWTAAEGVASSPAATTSRPGGAPLSAVPHPALALCSLNRLSATKVNKLAEEIIANGESTYTNKTELVQLLGFLGLVYDYESPASEELEQLHTVLEPYDLHTMMKRLTPSCAELLVKCIWRGQLTPCRELFSLRKTAEGFCCTFNYLRGSDYFRSENASTDEENKDRLIAMSGSDIGLSVLLNPALEDYFYTRLPHEGIKLLIFRPNDYPDVPSGSCIEKLIPPRRELYVSLDATLVVATDEVERLEANTRGCLIAKDKAIFKDSYSDCVVGCRIRSVRAACGCVPFHLPAASLQDICDLTDNVCLGNWKRSWDNAWSGEEDLLESGEDAGVERGPPCYFCLPACSEASYSAKQQAVSLQPEAVNDMEDKDKAPLKKGVVFKDHSVVHVFFTKDIVVHLTHDLLFSWYDWLNSLGGLCGLILGCSLVSIMEIVYFALGGPAKRRRPKQQEMRQLYWAELRRA